MAAQIFDGAGTAVWDLESSSLFIDAAKTSLPCGDQYWVHWFASFRPCDRLTFMRNRTHQQPQLGKLSSEA